MSHELRTPLNAIIGFSGLIQHLADQGIDNGKSLEYAANIEGAGRHLSNIVSDILDISKIESGTSTLDLEPMRHPRDRRIQHRAGAGPHGGQETDRSKCTSGASCRS